MFANAATSSMITPTNRNLPIGARSRLIVVASVAMVTNTAAVPPNASAISDTPFEKLSTEPMRRDNMRPMKNVKPSSSTTPQPLFLVFSMP